MFKFVDLPLQLPELESVDKNGKRYYPVPNGKFYPSITTVTSFKKSSQIMEWRKRVGEEAANKKTARATSRGTSYHSIVETYLKNEPVDQHKNKILAYNLFQASKPILDRISNIHALETSLYSDYLGVAGRVDCIAEFDGELAVIDFKTSDKEKREDLIENYFVQETAYAVMFYERTGIKPVKIVTIIATEEGHCQIFQKYDLNHYFVLLKEYINEFERINK
jgi:genome maintenance exonuclease 1